ncbi:hypothetical protein ACLOJK_041322 [Asimina triloba]
MPENPAMTFDEASMERSKNFINALQGFYDDWVRTLYKDQALDTNLRCILRDDTVEEDLELKNLRPQLYSAAEYCEKSYLHSEQKQMVLDNLKDYAVRALVNAVDHLGTQLLTCQTYTDKEGLRQQRLETIIPKHHKHYILPKSPASKTLSWHLSSDNKPVLNGTSQASQGNGERGTARPTPRVFHLLDAEEASFSPSLTHHPAAGSSCTFLGTFGATGKDSSEATKSLVAFRSFDTPGQRETSHPPVRSKSMLSSFFMKRKSAKRKADTY